MKFNIVIPEWLPRERKAYLYDTLGKPPMIEAESVEAAYAVLKHAIELMNRTIGYPVKDEWEMPIPDRFKCNGKKQPICQRCNLLVFDHSGGMLPEAKLGKCKNFQNKRK